MVDCMIQSCIDCPERNECKYIQESLRAERRDKALYALLGLAAEMNNDAIIDIIINVLNDCDLMEQYEKYVHKGVGFRMECL